MATTTNTQQPVDVEKTAAVSSNGKAAGAGSGSDNDGEFIEKLEHAAPGYAMDRNSEVAKDIIEDEDSNPNIHHHMSWELFAALTAMSFLWVGSQIPLYMIGSVIPLLYADIGGYEIYVWLVIGYLIPNAALCPFVGALSDLVGRKPVAAVGQVLLIIGPIVTVTASSMRPAIGGMVLSGLGAGLNELIALAGTAELVPVRKRGTYVGMVVFTILPFCPSVLWAQLIAKESSWRYVGIPVGAWNLIGLLLVLFVYKDPARNKKVDKKKVLREVDYIGGFLSTTGVVLFMAGMQWGVSQYAWGSAHVLVPFILGLLLIVAFFVWEFYAPYPMAPRKLFSKAKRTMSLILLITFFSGGNFFVLLLFWPTQIYNVYGDDPVGVGIRSLPIGFGIIGGAAIALMLIPVIKGRTTALIIVATAIMTLGTGLMSLATPYNLNSTYAIVTIGSIGTGAVIIPSSIIAQIVCPPELIGTITAITLAIRYIGGAIGFTAYSNVFYHKLETYLVDSVGYAVVANGIAAQTDVRTIGTLITLGSQAMFADLEAYIQASPTVMNKEIAYDVVITALQEGFALGYRWPYWISIAFGAICFILSFGLKDIRQFL